MTGALWLSDPLGGAGGHGSGGNTDDGMSTRGQSGAWDTPSFPCDLEQFVSLCRVCFPIYLMERSLDEIMANLPSGFDILCFRIH